MYLSRAKGRNMLLIMEKLLGISDVARELAVTRQAIRDRYERGRLPKPSYLGPKDGPLWKRAVLVRDGVLKTVSTGKSQEGEPDE